MIGAQNDAWVTWRLRTRQGGSRRDSFATTNLSAASSRAALLFHLLRCSCDRSIFLRQIPNGAALPRRTPRKRVGHNKAVNYDKGVDLSAYVKASTNSGYFILALNDGTILDFNLPKEGVPEGLLPRVTCPILSDAAFKGPTTVSYASGAKYPESWTVEAKHLEGGTVVVGFSELDHVDRGPERLNANISALGSTLDDVQRRWSRAIDIEMAWALIDDNQHLVNGVGRIPLITDPMLLGKDSARGSGYRKLGAAPFYVLYSPIERTQCKHASS